MAVMPQAPLPARAYWVATLVVIVSLMVYLVDGRSHTMGQSGDTDSNQLLPISLIAGEGFTFDKLVSPDKLPYAIGRGQQHLVALYPIVPGLINTITYAVALQLDHQKALREDTAYLSLITGSVVTALSVGAVYLVLAQSSGALGGALLALLYAFGTSAFSVASRGIWQHGPALLFITTAIVLLRHGSNRLLPLAGLALGLAVESRVPVLVLILPLFAIPWQRGPRALATFTLAFVIPIGLMRLYAWHYWGSAFVLAENMIASGVPFAGGNVLEGLAGVLVSPARGLFVYSPFLLFAVFGLITALKHRDGFLIPVAIGVIFYIVTLAIWNNWWGGKSFGTRMLTEILPGGILLASRPIAEWWNRRGWRRGMIVAVIGWSLLVNYAGARHYPQLPPRTDAQEYQAAWSLRDNELVACLDALRQRAGAHVAKFREH